MTAAPLQWLYDDHGWFTPRDDDHCRFVITRQSGPATRYTLEVRQYRGWDRIYTVQRQLRNIKSLDEAKRIAAEDWS